MKTAIAVVVTVATPAVVAAMYRRRELAIVVGFVAGWTLIAGSTMYAWVRYDLQSFPWPRPDHLVGMLGASILALTAIYSSYRDRKREPSPGPPPTRWK
ncbi:MAG: hypothetical protein QOG03_1546 [Actinomycetota bacterium]|jgi:hypothetical protein|nr:hypothetical protein [Actinomycetota bacterium]